MISAPAAPRLRSHPRPPRTSPRDSAARAMAQDRARHRDGPPDRLPELALNQRLQIADAELPRHRMPIVPVNARSSQRNAAGSILGSTTLTEALPGRTSSLSYRMLATSRACAGSRTSPAATVAFVRPSVRRERESITRPPDEVGATIRLQRSDLQRYTGRSVCAQVKCHRNSSCPPRASADHASAAKPRGAPGIAIAATSGRTFSNLRDGVADRDAAVRSSERRIRVERSR